MVLAIGVIGWAIHSRLWVTGTSSRLAFEGRDWLLLTEVENGTDQLDLGSTVRHLLELDLAGSRHVRVVSQGRVEDALRLMRRPLDSKVDEALAREICLRDGAIRAFVAGRIEKLGSVYVISTEVRSPEGALWTTDVEEANALENVPAAIRRVSARLREALGEAKSGTVDERARSFERVTTSSIHALGLYTEAVELGNRGEWAAAVPLLRQALEEDPEFASAHNWLAWAFYNIGRPDSEYLPQAFRAVELADRTAERERYFILSSYFGWTRDEAQRLSAQEALYNLHPDHFWNTNNLGLNYARMGRVHEAAARLVEAATLRPNSNKAHVKAAEAILLTTGSLTDEAFRVHAAMAKSLPPEDDFFAPWPHHLPTFEKWVYGDLAGARDEILESLSVLPTISGRQASFRRAYLTQFFLALGELRSAAAVARGIPDPFLREHLLALVAFATEDSQMLRSHLREAMLVLDDNSHSTSAVPVVAALLARSGLSAESGTMKELLDRRGYPLAHLRFVEGELALAEGRPREAIPALRDAMLLFRWFGAAPTHLAAASLAAALIENDDRTQALEVLEESAARKTRSFQSTYLGTTAWLWQRNQADLAALYQQLGRLSEADEVARSLVESLRGADPNHPILRRMQGLGLAGNSSLEDGR
jgi:tetratricopeptide (TPR) repeat protein